jgi:hypothetical protein
MLCDIISQIRAHVETSMDFPSLMLPAEGFEQDVLSEGGEEDTRIDEGLGKLLDETRDLFESEDFKSVLAVCLDSVFETVTKSLEPMYVMVGFNKDRYIVDGSEEKGEAKIIEYRQLPLAKIVPVVSKLAGQILGTGDDTNMFVESITERNELKAYSCVIYTSF